MGNNKYIIIDNDCNNLTVSTGMVLHRIQAIRDFGDVKEGDIGGYVESERNLSQYDTCWIYDNAKAFERAEVSGNAQIRSGTSVFGDAQISGYAVVEDYSTICGNARIFDYAKVSGHSHAYGNARICGTAKVGNVSVVEGYTVLS